MKTDNAQTRRNTNDADDGGTRTDDRRQRATKRRTAIVDRAGRYTVGSGHYESRQRWRTGRVRRRCLTRRARYRTLLELDALRRFLSKPSYGTFFQYTIE